MTFYCFKISGIVQGVGFRPFIYREAMNRGLKGYVKNTGQGVEIVCDDREVMEAILENLPPLAKVDRLEISTPPNRPYPEEEFPLSFEILFSSDVETQGAKIPADTATCDKCVAELLDRENRRHGYFFISCTDCGPRYSIAESLPFDRATTSLKSFKLCTECEDDYTDPNNRRFHAQTTACPKCGPQLKLYKDGKKIDGDPIEKTIELLKKGEIISIKGIGGFSLFSKTDKTTTKKLRNLLKRPYKPFAMMVKDLEMAKKIVEVSKMEAVILQSKERPIVLCKKNKFNSVSPLQGGEPSDLSPNNRIGVMLPYTGLHHLLFEAINEPLIVTSANLPGIPIPTKREVQDWKYILDYDRKITNFSDDSIIKCINDTPLMIRRSRGYAPNEIEIPDNYQNFDKDLLAVGGELKNTFCLKHKNTLLLSPHIGNTATLENLENFQKTLRNLQKFVPIKPQKVLHDKNPAFNTTHFAKNLKLPTLEIQHHLAHAFAVALEHNLDDFVAIIADGNGFGDDGRVWGGEVFTISHKQLAINNKTVGAHHMSPIQRIGHLEYQPLVGGDSANKNPVKILTGILSKFMDTKKIPAFLFKINSGFKPSGTRIYCQQVQQGINVIQTSSCGRTLDAASILLGFGEKNHYEGYLAERLESNSYPCTQPPLTPPKRGEHYPLFLEPIIEEKNGIFILKTTELFKFLVKNLENIPREKLATFVQLYLAKGLYQITQKYLEKEIQGRPSAQKRSTLELPIVFSGGCTYNDIMTIFLSEKGVKLNKDIPAGDGSISAGQVAYHLWQSKA